MREISREEFCYFGWLSMRMRSRGAYPDGRALLEFAC